jgi:hypothetical protein
MAAHHFNSISIENLIHGPGLNVRTPVRAATVVAGTLSSSFANSSTIDGVTLATGDRILIKNQASAVENGVYIVAASGAPARAEDLLTGISAVLYYVWVSEGTVNKSLSFVCTSAAGAAVVGTNNLTFERAAGVNTVDYAAPAVDNRVVRFDGTTGTIQGSVVTIGDTGIVSGVGDIVFAENTNNLTLAVTDQASGTATVTIPDLGGVSQNFVLVSQTQTLSNKTLAAPSITGNVTFDKATNDLTLAVTDQATGTATITIPDVAGVSQNVALTAHAQTLTNKSLVDANTFIIDDADNTKRVQFQVSGVTTGTTRTLTVPDASTTIVGTDATQTLTNKTYSAPIITGNTTYDKATNDLTLAVTDQGTSPATATIPDLGGVSQNFVFTTLAQTLSNKTLGTDLSAGNFKITNLAAPTGNLDAANKQYVDSVAAGLDPKESVRVATTANIGTYNTGTPDTLTSVANTQDGVTLVVGYRVLVRAQTDAKQNGIYRVTAVAGTSSLERAPDQDGSVPAEVSAGNFTFVEAGTTYASTGWILTGAGVLTLNTDNLIWAQFSGAGTYLAGSGLLLTGNTFSAVTSGSSTGISGSNEIVVRSNATAGQVLRSTGTGGQEATWGSLDLTNADAVSGSLPVNRGGTGAATFASGELLQGNGTSAISSTGISSANVVTTTGTQTLTNKSLVDATTFIIDDADNTKRLQFQVSGVSTATTRTLTVPDASTVVVGTDTTQTLSNKTLTAPRFADLGFIADSTGATMLEFDSVASAVNYLSLGNAASTSAPSLTAAGSDTNVGLRFQTKGTGTFDFLGTAAQQASIRLFEDTDNGTDAITIRAPASLAAPYTLTLPPDDGLANQVLQTNGSGVTSWVNTPSSRVSYAMTRNQVSATSTTATAIAYHAWLNSEYTDLGTSCRVIFWAANLTNRDLTVTLHDGTSSIGSTTITSGTGDGNQQFTFTKPSSNVRLELRISKSANGGVSPSIFASQLEFTA